MKLIAFCVFDSAVGAFNRPFFAPSAGAAERSFVDEVNRDAPENPMFAHPEHFALYMCGSFEDSSGVFEVQVPPVLLCQAVNVVRRPAHEGQGQLKLAS